MFIFQMKILRFNANHTADIAARFYLHFVKYSLHRKRFK